MIYLQKLLASINLEEAIENLFEEQEIDCTIGECLEQLENSDIEYGWFVGANALISFLLYEYGSVNGSGNYYVADDNLNFTFFESSKELIESLEDYNLSEKEKKQILKNLSL